MNFCKQFFIFLVASFKYDYKFHKTALLFNLSQYYHNFTPSIPLVNYKSYPYIYTESRKKRRNFNNSIRYGKQTIYFFSLNYKFLLQYKALVLITKKLSNDKLPLHPEFYHYTYRQFHCINVRRIENCIFFCATFLLRFSIYVWSKTICINLPIVTWPLCFDTLRVVS